MNNIDLNIVLLLNQQLASPGLDWFMSTVSDRNLGLLFSAIVFLWFLLRKDRERLIHLSIVAVSLICIDWINYHLIKEGIERFRPCKEYAELVRLVAGCAGRFGFPSNHSANLMALSGMVYLFMSKRVGLILGGLALLVGFSRVYLGVHYPTDVIAGFLIGAIWAYLTYQVMRLSLIIPSKKT